MTFESGLYVLNRKLEHTSFIKIITTTGRPEIYLCGEYFVFDAVKGEFILDINGQQSKTFHLVRSSGRFVSECGLSSLDRIKGESAIDLHSVSKKPMLQPIIYINITQREEVSDTDADPGAA